MSWEVTMPDFSGKRVLLLLAPVAPVLAVILWLAARFQVAMGLFLIAHGLIHGSYLQSEPKDAPPGLWPFHLDRSWVLTTLGMSARITRGLGIVLVALTVLGFLTAGAGVLADQEWWQGAAVVAAVLSLLLLGLYFRLFLILGLVIDAFILSVTLLGWPSVTYTGN